MGSYPSVSVICTTSRPQFLPRLYGQFTRQKYPAGELELRVVCKWASREHPFVTNRTNRINLHFAPDSTIGGGRNVAVRESDSEYIVVFDDDDWQSPHRVERQIMHLMLTGKAVVGCMDPTMYRESEPHAWRCLDRMEHSAGGLLAFRRDWALEHPFSEAPSPFPEDTDFVQQAIRHDQFSNISGLELAVLSNHDCNDSKRGEHMPEVEQLHDLAQMFGDSTSWRKIPYETVKHIVEG